MTEYPIDREFDSNGAPIQTPRTEYKKDNRKLTLLPAEAGKTYDNRLLFVPFQLNKYRWFQKFPDMKNFYATLYVHYVQVAVNGNVLTRGVICEKEMNRFVREKLSSPLNPIVPPFEKDDCAFCDESNRLWKDFSRIRKERGIDGLSKDDYKIAMDSNPDLKKIRDEATAWQPSLRYYSVVFDIGKYQGEKQMTLEDDGQVVLQYCILPQGIIQALVKKRQKKNYFYDYEKGGARVVVITRDNTRSARFCDYTVDTEGEPPQLDGDVMAYLQQADDLPTDPADILQEWTVAEKKAYLQSFGSTPPPPPVRRAVEARPAPAPRAVPVETPKVEDQPVVNTRAKMPWEDDDAAADETPPWEVPAAKSLSVAVEEEAEPEVKVPHRPRVKLTVV